LVACNISYFVNDITTYFVSVFVCLLCYICFLSLFGGCSLVCFLIRIALVMQTTIQISLYCGQSVCHIRAPCLKRSTDLDAIWQIHLWYPKTQVVTLMVIPNHRVWRHLGLNSQPKAEIANTMLLCCLMANKMRSSSAFCQVILVLVLIDIEVIH